MGEVGTLWLVKGNMNLTPNMLRNLDNSQTHAVNAPKAFDQYKDILCTQCALDLQYTYIPVPASCQNTKVQVSHCVLLSAEIATELYRLSILHRKSYCCVKRPSLLVSGLL